MGVSKAALAALPLIFLTPGVAAEATFNEMQFGPPAYALGDLDYGSASGFAAFYGTTSDAALRLHATILDGEALYSDITDRYLVLDSQHGSIPQARDNQTQVVGQGSFDVDLREVFQNLTVALVTGGPLQAALEDAEIGRPLRSPFLSSSGARGSESLEPFEGAYEGDWPNRWRVQVTGAMNHIRSENVRLTYQGPLSLTIAGAALDLHDQGVTHLRTGDWKDERESTPLEPWTYTRHHAALTISGVGSVTIEYVGPFGHLGAPVLQLANVTSLSAPLARTTLDTVSGDQQSVDGSYLDVSGLFTTTLQTPSNEEWIHASLAGTIVEVQENRNSVIRLADPPTIALVSIATLLLIAGTTVATIGRDTILGVFRNEASPLGNPARRHLLEQINQHPGLSESQLTQLLNGRTRLARYHLSVLLRARLIARVQHKSRVAYLPNSGAYQFSVKAAQSGRGDEPQPVHLPTALAVLAHPQRQTIYADLIENGGLSFSEWHQKDTGNPLSHRMFNFHAERMEEIGLIFRHRDGRKVVWKIGADLRPLILAEQQRQARLHPLQAAH